MELRREKGESNMPGAGVGRRWVKGEGKAREGECTGSSALRAFKGRDF